MIRRDRTRLHKIFQSRVMPCLNHLWPPHLTQLDFHAEVLWGHVTWCGSKNFYGKQSKYHGVIVVCFLLFCFGNSTKECVPFTQRTGKSSRKYVLISLPEAHLTWKTLKLTRKVLWWIILSAIANELRTMLQEKIVKEEMIFIQPHIKLMCDLLAVMLN